MGDNYTVAQQECCEEGRHNYQYYSIIVNYLHSMLYITRLLPTHYFLSYSVYPPEKKNFFINGTRTSYKHNNSTNIYYTKIRFYFYNTLRGKGRGKCSECTSVLSSDQCVRVFSPRIFQILEEDHWASVKLFRLTYFREYCIKYW